MATNLAILRFFLLAVTFCSSSALRSQKKFQSEEIQHRILELSDPAKPKNIDPSQVIQLSWQPRVFLYRGFLSEEECDYLTSWVHGKETYTIQDDLGITVDADNEIARRIEERISAWTFLPKENSKSLSVLHIGPEASTKNHHYFESRYVDQVGEQPLLATVILYLSNVSRGGQLLFPQSKNDIWSDCTKNSNMLRPSVGNAILFFNLNLDVTMLDVLSSKVICGSPPNSFISKASTRARIRHNLIMLIAPMRTKIVLAGLPEVSAKETMFS